MYKSKLFKICTFLLIGFIFLLLIKEISAAPVCCEKTTDGKYCQYVEQGQCAADAKQAPTNCAFTSFCKPGCCFDLNDGRCYANMPQASCAGRGEDSSFGEDPTCALPQCEMGCCIIGTQASLITQTRCKKETAKYPDLQMVFKPEIKDEIQCVSLSRSQDVGCCVQDKDSCTYTIRENCAVQTGTSLSGTGFFKNRYCSDQELICDCAPGSKTQKKGCLEGKDDVYYFDSCGNPESVVEDCDYVTKHNTCGLDSDTNSYKCLDLSCKASYDIKSQEATTIYSAGATLENGDAWCEYDVDPSKGLIGFGKDVPGSRYYRGFCLNNKVFVEPCADYRKEWCIQDKMTINSEQYTAAACRANRWESCTAQNDAINCGNTDMRDCFWTDLGTNSKGEPQGACLPFISPGAKFWEGEGADICAAASQECKVKFYMGGIAKTLNKGKDIEWLRSLTEYADKDTMSLLSFIGLPGNALGVGYTCIGNCDCLKDEFLIHSNNVCRAVGDCGADYNILTDVKNPGLLMGIGRTPNELPDNIKNADCDQGKKGVQKCGGDYNPIISSNPTQMQKSYSYLGRYDLAKKNEEPKKWDQFQAVLNSGVLQGLISVGLSQGVYYASSMRGTGTKYSFLGNFAKGYFEPIRLVTGMLGSQLGKLGGDQAKNAMLGKMWNVLYPESGKKFGEWAIPAGTNSKYIQNILKPNTITGKYDVAALQELAKANGLSTQIEKTISTKPFSADELFGVLKTAGQQPPLINSATQTSEQYLSSLQGIAKTNNIPITNDVKGLVDMDPAKLAESLGGNKDLKIPIEKTGWGKAIKGFNILQMAYQAMNLFDTLAAGTEDVTIKVDCKTWQAPLSSNNCEMCNQKDGDRKFKKCSEYLCKSLGQSCVLLNPGTTNETCVSQNPHDVTPPIIKVWKEGLGIYKDKITEATNGYTYTEEIPAFTTFPIALFTDEPAKCKGALRQGSFDNMTDFVGSDLFDYNHLQFMALPEQYTLSLDTNDTSGNVTLGVVLAPGGTYTLYIKCIDSLKNENVAPYTVRFKIKTGPDTTPPVIEGSSIISGSYVLYGINKTDATIYVNEPSDCKFSQREQDYSTMEGNMTCNNNIINDAGLYECTGTLDPIVDGMVNNFYFRCKDQPGVKEEDRNVNSQSYKLTLKGSYPLIIDSIEPANETEIHTSNFTLRVETSKGASLDGKAYCYYGETNNINLMTQFFKTNSSVHEQVLSPARRPDPYTFYVICIDYGGNMASTLTKVKIEKDVKAPLVTRVYIDDSFTPSHLVILIDEPAECQYSLEKDFTYGDGTAMATDSTQIRHDAVYEEGATYYIRCKDSSNNLMLHIFHA